MAKKILVVSQYFFPEQFRINDICKEWKKRGYEVTVLTGIPNYPEGSFFKGYGYFKSRKDNYEGVNIIRLPIIPRGKNPIMLALNYFSFVISGFFWAKFTREKHDCVFIYEVSPMTQALPGVWYAKRKKIPSYIYVMDLWPENVEIIAGIKNEKVINMIGKMVDYVYRNCNKIFAASESFVEAINARGVPKEKIEFWPQYAEDFYKPVARSNNEIPQDGTLNITFAGNIGEAQGLSLLPDAVRILRDRNIKVRFNIIGDGRYKSRLQDEIYKNEMSEYFNFIERQPAVEIPKYMANSDVALISLSPNKVFNKTIPAKVQSCLACGKPLLVLADGEIQRVVNEANCGFAGDANDIMKFVENIKKFSCLNEEEIDILGNNSLEYSKKKFDKSVLLSIMDKYIGGVNNV